MRVTKKKLLEINSIEFYTLYGCHNLNIVIYDVATSYPRAITSFWILQGMILFFAKMMKNTTK